jgi:hypothetical protein
MLDERVDERETQIGEMLEQNNQQRSSTVQVLENLLETEREACAEANKRVEVLSLQLQATQGKLDMIQQEPTSVRLNETALDSKVKASYSRRTRGEATESVHYMGVDDDNSGRRRKRSKSTTSPFKNNHTEDGGSVFFSRR